MDRLGRRRYRFIVAAYYSTLVAWVVNYIFASLRWHGAPTRWVFQQHRPPVVRKSRPAGRFFPPVLIGLLITWLVVIFAMRKGVEKNEACQMDRYHSRYYPYHYVHPGGEHARAADGIRYYITPDWSALGNFDVWRAAFGQVAYSMSILFALMITYGSFEKGSDIPKDSIVIGLSDMGISLLAGFVVFSTLGYLSKAAYRSMK